MERARLGLVGRGAGLTWRNPTVLSPILLPPQRSPLKPPAQARWASGRVDLSNKTYETIASLGSAAPQSQNEACPPPLPVKNPSRTVVQGRAGHASGGTAAHKNARRTVHGGSPVCRRGAKAARVSPRHPPALAVSCQVEVIISPFQVKEQRC